MPAADASGLDFLSRTRRLKARFAPAGSFADNALTLMTGTAIAQGIQVAAAPILTRLYSPSDFGVFALYLSITTLLSTVISSSYAFAIVLPEKDEDAVNILALSVLLAFGASVITLLAVWLFNAPIARLLGNSAVSRWLYFVPLSVFTVCVFQSLNYWATRRKQFALLATRQVTQSGVMVGTQAFSGLMQAGTGGMVAGLIAGQGIATGMFAGSVLKEDGGRLRDVGIPAMLVQSRRYQRFLLFASPSSLVNVASLQAPVVLLTAFFSPVTAGLFALTQAVVATPLTFLTNSVKGVFLERASKDFNKLGNCRRIYLRTVGALFLFGLAPTVLFVAAAPRLISLVFGPQWEVAGEYAQILSGMYFICFLASTVSCVVDIAGKQHYELAWNVSTLAATAAAISAGGVLHDPKVSIICYAVSRSVMYAGYLFMSYKCSQGRTSS